MENPNDWTSEKDVSCMYSLSQQDTSRDNRLNMLVESRVRREVQARFGGEFLKPTVEIRQGTGFLAYGSQRSTSCCSSQGFWASSSASPECT